MQKKKTIFIQSNDDYKNLYYINEWIVYNLSENNYF